LNDRERIATRYDQSKSRGVSKGSRSGE